MAGKGSKFNKLQIGFGDSQSRFVVNLKERFEQEKEEMEKKEKRAEKYFDKIAEFNIADYLKKFKTRKVEENYIGLVEEKIEPVISEKFEKKETKLGKDSSFLKDALKMKFETAKEKSKKKKAQIKNPSNELAVISFFKFFFTSIGAVGNLLFKICYGVGWLAIFIVRLICIITFKSLKLILSPLKFLFDKINYFFLKITVAIGKAAYFSWIGTAGFSKIIALGIAYFFRSVYAVTCHKTNTYYVNASEAARSGAKNLIPKPKFAYLKPTIYFIIILSVIIVPFKAYTYYKSLDGVKGKVLGASEKAVDSLMSAGKSAFNLDLVGASENFSQAGSDFETAQNQLEEINGIMFALAKVMPDQNIRLAGYSKNILAAGQAGAELGNNLTKALDAALSDSEKEKNIKILLENFNTYGEKSLANAEEIDRQLGEIDETALPEEYQQQFKDLKGKVSILKSGLSEAIEITKMLASLIGINGEKRYLFVFQNNTEIRASGGFIGSYALIDFKGGNIEKLEAPGGGSYDTEGGLQEKVASPEPLHLVNPLWHFWDANWWPDWPTSARKLEWFYERSDGPTVDGIISLTPTVAEKFLEITGPIDMTKEYGVVLDSKNFWVTTQTFTEQKFYQTNKPKKIIGDLMNRILEELPKRLNKDNLLPLLKMFDESAREKHILFYFNDGELEKKIEELGWDGKVDNTNWDYLSVINSNIAGQKTDRRIRETIEHTAEVMPDGSIIDNVLIRREHTGVKNEPFCGVRNVDWMRVYVPLGSELISAEGFKPVDKIYFENADPSWKKDEMVAKEESEAMVDEKSGTRVYSEFNKTVFANWSQVDPGGTAEIKLRYKLPFSLKNEEKKETVLDKAINLLNPLQKQLFPYSILVQKQPGSANGKIISKLKIHNQSQIVWKYPETVSVNKENSGWEVNDTLDADKFWAVLLENK